MTQYDPYSAAPPGSPLGAFAIAPQRRPLATIQGKFPLTVLTLEDGPRGGVCICEYYGPCQPTRIWDYATYLDALNALILWLNRPGHAPRGWYACRDYDDSGGLVWYLDGDTG
jgi:hypothetical protein